MSGVDNLISCQTINIKLRNEVLIHSGQYQGTYEKSASVNGKPSWTSQSKAIWKHPRLNTWMIGNLKDTGTHWGSIYTNGLGLRSKYSKWYNGKIWKQLDPIDFSIECISRKGTLLFISHPSTPVFTS